MKNDTELNERPADLKLWFRDGCCGAYRARVQANAEVSIGRTDSKLALGFRIMNGKKKVDFVLDKDQVTALAEFLQLALPRLRKPLGRKPGADKRAMLQRRLRADGLT